MYNISSTQSSSPTADLHVPKEFPSSQKLHNTSQYWDGKNTRRQQVITVHNFLPHRHQTKKSNPITTCHYVLENFIYTSCRITPHSSDTIQEKLKGRQVISSSHWATLVIIHNQNKTPLVQHRIPQATIPHFPIVSFPSMDCMLFWCVAVIMQWLWLAQHPQRHCIMTSRSHRENVMSHNGGYCRVCLDGLSFQFSRSVNKLSELSLGWLWPSFVHQLYYLTKQEAQSQSLEVLIIFHEATDTKCSREVSVRTDQKRMNQNSVLKRRGILNQLVNIRITKDW